MNKIKVGIIGLGRFSKLHLQALKYIPNIELVAVSDIISENVEKVVSDWKCRGYTDWRKMLNEAPLDAVIILTPESLHLKPVIESLYNNCHVFVEKPLATDFTDANSMMQLAEKREKQLMVGHVCRFDARYIRIKESIDNGNLGKVRSIYARRNNAKKYFSIYKRTDPIYILGIHDIDLMHWFTDSYVTGVYARRTGSKTGEHNLVWAMLQFENGAIGIIENNWLVPEGAPSEVDVQMEVVGEIGTAHIKEPDNTLTYWDNKQTHTPPMFNSTEVYGQPVGALYEELQHFFKNIYEEKSSSILVPKDALRAVQVADAIIKSCENDIPIKLDTKITE